jgi:hypothetical protein
MYSLTLLFNASFVDQKTGDMLLLTRYIRTKSISLDTGKTSSKKTIIEVIDLVDARAPFFWTREYIPKGLDSLNYCRAVGCDYRI